MLLPLSNVVLPASYITTGSMPAFSTGVPSISIFLSTPGPALQARQQATNAIEAMNEPVSASIPKTGSGPLYSNSSTSAFILSTSVSVAVPPVTTTMVTITVAPELPTSTTTSHTGICWRVSPIGGPPGGLCMCTDSSLWAISPVMVTHTLNGQPVLSVDACPFTVIPSTATSTALPAIITTPALTTTSTTSIDLAPTTYKQCNFIGNGLCYSDEAEEPARPTTAPECAAAGYCWVNGKCLARCQRGVSEQDGNCYQWHGVGCPPRESDGPF